MLTHRALFGTLINRVSTQWVGRMKSDWIGSLLGLAGAALLALHISVSHYGWFLFLASNVFWTSYAVKSRTWSLVVMQCGFSATSILGIVRWFNGNVS